MQCWWCSHDSVLLMRQREKSHGRHHYSTLFRLICISLWMMWYLIFGCYGWCLGTHVIGNPMRFFTSHFYSKLSDGLNGVSNASEWLSWRNNDFFLKHGLHFPINLHEHWLLLLATNPSKVRGLSFHDVSDGSCERPIILQVISISG